MKQVEAKRKRLWIWLGAVGGVLLALVIASAIYLGSYYHADTAAIDAFAATCPISCVEMEDGNILVAPEGATKGLIFYPGGKVEHTAYLPLMQACAEEGFLCVLVKMPFRLAVFDINAADGIREAFPAIEEWYIGGHSLGGSMAASYLGSHADEYAGLILLGSYSTEDLSETNLSVLSIYGSEDGVMNREKYEENRGHLPNLTEVIIEGGCHAYFGMYGAQKGDGSPTLTAVEQIRRTAQEIAACFGE